MRPMRLGGPQSCLTAVFAHTRGSTRFAKATRLWQRLSHGGRRSRRTGPRKFTERRAALQTHWVAKWLCRWHAKFAKDKRNVCTGLISASLRASSTRVAGGGNAAALPTAGLTAARPTATTGVRSRAETVLKWMNTLSRRADTSSVVRDARAVIGRPHQPWQSPGVVAAADPALPLLRKRFRSLHSQPHHHVLVKRFVTVRTGVHIRSCRPPVRAPTREWPSGSSFLPPLRVAFLITVRIAAGLGRLCVV